MEKEITNSFSDTRSESLVDRSLIDDTKIARVNGHNLPDEEDDAEDEDDLVLGDEAEVDEVDYNEDEIEVELDDEDVDADDADEDDLVLGDDDEDEEEDRI